MARQRKSPQQKKEMEYTKDHFTFASSSKFPKVWKRKKALVNREFRRKSDELLTQAKPGIAADDVELLGDDLTAARFQKSVARKRLLKWTRSASARAGRKVRLIQHHDQAAASAISRRGSLRGEELVAVVMRADLLSLRGGAQSKGTIDHALHFIYCVAILGSAQDTDALHRNLAKALGIWIEKAMRILTRDKRAVATKLDQRRTRRKLKDLTALRNRLRFS